ncbi:MAG: bifunctional histidinol-phosphatase/imidazoleglycerol-phosphate dehydratase HisB, partial [Arenimonas sp.]|nr:bifunctional histidinol-phosphatase/imidazoleglycerol-phosphate dehydratase HisB [Arenimonas sp.]
MRKILFLDRDGTLIVEPPDQQIDSLAKFALVDGVIPALLRLKDAGYRFVMVSNQDGLGTASFPEADFHPPQELLLQILSSQGIAFDDILIDRSFPHEHLSTRKPGIRMLVPYLKDSGVLWEQSAVIGDRDTDLQLAANLGCRGFKLGDGLSWPDIVAQLLATPRTAELRRDTQETRIAVALNLDSEAPVRIATGIGFFDHMLEQLAKHGGFALQLDCAGDTHIDEHHTVEDCAIALGQALKRALGDKVGIERYGFSLPMDEARAEALLDISNRGLLKFEGRFPREAVGTLPTELVPHFFQSLAESAGFTLHLKVEGDNTHH